MTARPLANALGAVLLASSVLTACSSDSKSTDDATVETYTTVPASQVVSGLAGTQQLMTAAAAAGVAASQTTVDSINGSWLVYEGNIRINDAAAYLSAEDALASFSKAALAGDAAGMTSAAAAFASMATAYTAAHPG